MRVIPALVPLQGAPWEVLPIGTHIATMADIQAAFATNPGRRTLFKGLAAAMQSLSSAGCRTVYLDGSFVSAKPNPQDYDACWDPDGVDVELLDPVFLTFENSRHAQKHKYAGEFFPVTSVEARSRTSFLQFFQTDRFTGAQKGILVINLTKEPFADSRKKP